MKITKIGHCCLLIEAEGVRLLTDPGMYSSEQNELAGLDAVLITHEHADHFHLESVKKIVANNPGVAIITNSSVAKLLAADAPTCQIIDDDKRGVVKGLTIEGMGTRHAEIYEEMGQVENTSYLIGGQFFMPGDALYNPERPIKILALPVAGPWLTLKDAIEYAKALKPEVCFPVHEAMIHPDRLGPLYRIPTAVLPPLGIKFEALADGILIW